jgi:hypothetical protein
MKQCPQCGSIYSDDTLNFCLTDRSSLVPVGDVDDAQTVIRERSAAPRTEVFHEPSPTIADTSAFPVSAGVSPVFKYLAIGLGLVLLLLTIGGFAAWSLLRSRSEQTVMANGANATPAVGARPVTADKTRTRLTTTATAIHPQIRMRKGHRLLRPPYRRRQMPTKRIPTTHLRPPIPVRDA